MKSILIYLLNKLGHFIIIDASKINTSTKWTHYSMNVSFWGKKRSLDDMFINGEQVDIQELGIWNRHLQAEEVKEIKS